MLTGPRSRNLQLHHLHDCNLGGRVWLYFLPAYSSELNPDEWVWKNVKHDCIGEAGVRSTEYLSGKAEYVLRRLQRLLASSPHLSSTPPNHTPRRSSYLRSLGYRVHRKLVKEKK